MSQKISITPMMEQYLRLKEEHKDKLLLYRLGDFYELFFEDAKIAALEMDIVLTTRGKHLDKDIPMCGVPHLKLDHYLAKLIKSGHIVAICEQVESAEEAKKRGSKSIVKRQVTRIITPGTLIEEGYLESSSNNFLFTFVEKNSNGTAAWLDFSTGSIFIKDTISQRLIELIYEVKPSEIVLDNTSFYDFLNKRSDMPIVTISENGEPLYKKKLEDLIPSFDKSSYSDDELLAIEILINYCQETNKTKEMSFSAPIRISQSEFVEMDISTKNNLEIGNIELLESLPYLKFLELMKNAKAVFTDSGGIQEECTVLKIPCYTLRYNTERPITVTSGTNRLVNPEKNIIFDN